MYSIAFVSWLMKNILQKLLAQGKTSEVLAALQQQASLDDDFLNQVYILSARYAENERQYHAGTLEYASYSIELRKINAALLALIEKLEEKPIAYETKKEKKVTNSRLAKIGGILVATIGLLAGMAEITGFSLRDFFWEEQVPEISPQEKSSKKDTLVLEKSNTSAVKDTTEIKHNAATRNHFESKDQSRQVNIPDNQGTVNVNQ